LAGLERVGLGDRSAHYPDELSGGEMQRVAIARALVIQPEAVLCDEPTGNLDSASSKEILELLASLPEAGKRSVVMVTHDAQAAVYGHRIVHIRDGRVEADHAVDPSRQVVMGAG
jgi:putative ABC transport system ATP-binding protein